MGRVVEHVYSASGIYDVRLTASGRSQTITSTFTLEVEPSLELVASHALNIDSPSGLALSSEHQSLYTVSDKLGGKIYEIDLQGNRLRTLSYSGTDLEGVSYDGRDHSLWIVDESVNQLIHCDTDGDLFSVQNIFGVSDGSGLEGVAIDTATSRIFLLKEKDRGALIQFNMLTQSQTYLSLAFAPDYAGLDFDTQTGRLWIISDEASTLYDVTTQGEVVHQYGIDLMQPEGIAYDGNLERFYIVDDSADRLYVYRFWDE